MRSCLNSTGLTDWKWNEIIRGCSFRSMLSFPFYRPKDGKEDLGTHAYGIRNSSYRFHARVHGDLSASIRLASPHECGFA